MDKIIVINNMFDKDQSVMIYKDNQLITTTDVDLDNLVNTVKGLASEYSIHNIDLVGNESFLSQFKEKFSTEFGQLNVNIVAR